LWHFLSLTADFLGIGVSLSHKLFPHGGNMTARAPVLFPSLSRTPKEREPFPFFLFNGKELRII
jgi:hypothetical protein